MTASATRRHPGLNLDHGDEAAQQQTEELMFGFWIFLMSDLVLFALLFATFGTLRHALAGGPGPQSLFELGSAAEETALLLASSFTFGLATLSMKHEHATGAVLGWMGLTLLLGAGFLGLEVHDFVSMTDKGGGIDRSAFTAATFALVGTHGLHVTFGSLWIVVMMIQVGLIGHRRDDSATHAAGRRKLVDRVHNRMLRLALFWHFLDIVWIGIFSFVYLGGLAR